MDMNLLTTFWCELKKQIIITCFIRMATLVTNTIFFIKNSGGRMVQRQTAPSGLLGFVSS